MSIEVFLADDHTIVREGIKLAVEGKAKDIKIVGEASNGEEVLKMTKNNPADVYVLDISMPIINGIETTSRLIKREPKSKIIILSVHDEKTFVEKTLKCGARGYILKESATEELVRGIREVYKNKFYLSPKILKFIVQGFLDKKYPYLLEKEGNKLTKREREIIQLIAEGFSNKDVSERLKLSLNTVHVHRNNIMHKLDMHKQADLIRYALKEGIAKL